MESPDITNDKDQSIYNKSLHNDYTKKVSGVISKNWANDSKWQLLVQGYLRESNHLLEVIVPIVINFTTSNLFDPTVSILSIGWDRESQYLFIKTQNISHDEQKINNPRKHFFSDISCM